MNIKPTNDIDSLYDNGLIYNDDGTFSCPVCHKTYKREKSAIAHLNERECYSLLDMFKGTTNEMKGYSLYKDLVTLINPKSRLSINTFRKSNFYNGVMRLISFASVYEIGERLNEYIEWLVLYKNFSNMNGILSNAIKESFLLEFRVFLQCFGDTLINSDKFYSRYREDLLEDQNFFIRSLEKGHIWFGYFYDVDDFDIEEYYDGLDIEYKIRFDDLLSKVEKYSKQLESTIKSKR